MDTRDATDTPDRYRPIMNISLTLSRIDMRVSSKKVISCPQILARLRLRTCSLARTRARILSLFFSLSLVCRVSPQPFHFFLCEKHEKRQFTISPPCFLGLTRAKPRDMSLGRLSLAPLFVAPRCVATVLTLPRPLPLSAPPPSFLAKYHVNI